MTSFTELNIENFDTSKCTEFHFMFAGCKNLQKINSKNFNTENANFLCFMFQNCESLTELDLSILKLKKQ